MTCICIDVSRFWTHVPELLYVVVDVLGGLTAGLFTGGVMMALLECRLTRQIADFIRGEKSKRKHEEVD